MKIVPTACNKFDAVLMHYPNENICINKNRHYSVLYHMVVAYKQRVLMADWSGTPIWEPPSYLTSNHTGFVFQYKDN